MKKKTAKKTTVKKKVSKPVKEKNPDNKYVMLDGYNLSNVGSVKNTLVLELLIHIDSASSFKYINDVQLKDLQEQIKKANEKVEEMFHIKFKPKSHLKLGGSKYAIYQISNLKLVNYSDNQRKVSFKLNNYHSFTLNFEHIHNQQLGVLWWK